MDLKVNGINRKGDEWGPWVFAIEADDEEGRVIQAGIWENGDVMLDAIIGDWTFSEIIKPSLRDWYRLRRIVDLNIERLEDND